MNWNNAIGLALWSAMVFYAGLVAMAWWAERRKWQRIRNGAPAMRQGR